MLVFQRWWMDCDLGMLILVLENEKMLININDDVEKCGDEYEKKLQIIKNMTECLRWRLTQTPPRHTDVLWLP